MTLPALPAQGATSWYPWATGVDSAARNTARTDTANVFTGAQRINGGTGWNVDSSARQPFASLQTLDAAAVGTIDKVAHILNTSIVGNLGASSGSNPAFAWGLNVFTATGTAAGDGAGGNIQNLIEVAVAAPSGTIPSAMGLLVQAAFFGSTAGATVTQMESMRVGAPIRKDGATAGTATNVYGLFVEEVSAAAVGATGSVFSLFVAGGVTRLGGRVDVDSTIAATGTGGLNLQGALSAAGASMTLAPVAVGGGHAQIKLGGSGSIFAVATAGGSNLFVVDNTGAVSFTVGTTTTAPSAGGAGALPATPTGYATMTINGTARKVAYY